MHVFGTETHMTAVVGMALGKREIPHMVDAFDSNDAANMFFNAQDKGVSQDQAKMRFNNVTRMATHSFFVPHSPSFQILMMLRRWSLVCSCPLILILTFI